MTEEPTAVQGGEDELLAQPDLAAGPEIPVEDAKDTFSREYVTRPPGTGSRPSAPTPSPPAW